MGKSSPSPPPVPDPNVVAGAQTASNIATANNQAALNKVGSSGPYGSVLWQSDPSQPGGSTQVTTLSPAEQAIFNAYTSDQAQTLGVAGQQIGRVSSALSQPFSYAGLPSLVGSLQQGSVQSSLGAQPNYQMGYGQNPMQMQLGQQGPIQQGYNAGFGVQQGVNGNYADQVNQAINAAYGQATSRLDPQFQLQQQQLQQQLANQGLGQNSAAWQNAMDQFGRTRNDAYNQALYSAIGSGQNEQNTLFGQTLAGGQFANQAQAQQYGENQGQAAFANAAQNQGYQQQLGAGQFANEAALGQTGMNQAQAQFQNQAVNEIFQRAMASGQFANTAEAQQFAQQQAAAQFQNQARTQGAQEQAYAQNLPINQLVSLMGTGGQVQNPTGISYTPTSVAPTDVLGAYALSQQQANANYQTQLAQQQSLLGGLFNLGSSAAMAFSDIRLKRDILKVGTWRGHNAYTFRYLWSDQPMLGVMAQEVVRTRPDAVIEMPNGFYAVDYARL